jgi:hypothetical protein
VFVAGILAGLYNWLLEGGREGIWVASQKSIAGDGGFDKDIFFIAFCQSALKLIGAIVFQIINLDRFPRYATRAS